MKSLSYTLLADGTSDNMLRYVINWALRRSGVGIDQAQIADLGMIRKKPKTLADRVACALEMYPCDLLFIHRDAEKEPLSSRLKEIQTVMTQRREPHVAIIPIRMTEAWFLHDCEAIKQASGNPSGRTSLNLPRPNTVESLPNPKQILFDALLKATDATSGRDRKKKKRDLPKMRMRVAELIDDYSPLLSLPAFDHFMTDLGQILQQLDWDQPKTAR